MIGLIQRVTNANVSVDGADIANINNGILLLLGVEADDSKANAEKLAKKVCNLRMFGDDNGKMNLSLLDANLELLVVSQFTLAADLNSGNRPSFSKAASPELARDMYEYFVSHVRQHYVNCQTGEFAADMKITLTNDGPVTFHLKF